MISVYRFFKSHPAVFWFTLLISTALLAFVGSKVQYEEDISKLLPSSDDYNESAGIAFTDLKVKDKIFVQIQGVAGSDTERGTLMDAMDMFVETIVDLDSVDNDFDHEVLYVIDETDLLGALDFVIGHVPSFVDEHTYVGMDTLFRRKNVARCMRENLRLVNDGLLPVEMATTDPLNMRTALIGGDIRNTAGSFRMIDGYLFTLDSTVCLAFLNPNIKSMDSGAGTRLVGKLEAAVDSVQNNIDGVEVLFHGAPVNSANNSRRIKSDLFITMGISLIIICLLITLMFRNWGTLPMLLLPVMWGALFALSGIYLIHGSMSLMALGLGAIVLGVALSYCLHVLTHYKYVSDPEQVIREQLKPLLMGSLTTVGAFAGLLLTESALLRDFGLFALLAVIGTTIACLVFMPQFFRPENNRRNVAAFALVERVNNFPWDRQNWLIIILAIITICSVFYSGNVKFDNNLKNINYILPSVQKSIDLYTAKTQNGFRSQYYTVSSSNLDSAINYNQQLAAVLENLREAAVIHNYSKTGMLLVSTDVQRQRIKAWNDYFSPERKAEIRSLVTAEGIKAGWSEDAFEPFFELLDTDFEPDNIFDADILPHSLLSNIVEHTEGQYLVFTNVEMPAANIDNVNDIISAQPHATVVDPFYYTRDMVALMQSDFNRILGISSIFVFIVLLISLRNLFLSVIAFMPMGLSWYIVLAVMAAAGIPFNLINIVVSSFIFGIGVDYSIFVMDGLLARAKNPEADDRILRYHKTAILLSAIVLIICMASLLFAVHPAISSIGVAALVGMMSTLLITYCAEPFLFNLLTQTRFGKKIVENSK